MARAAAPDMLARPGQALKNRTSELASAVEPLLSTPPAPPVQVVAVRRAGCSTKTTKFTSGAGPCGVQQKTV